MARPSTSQAASRSQLVQPSPRIHQQARQTMMPRIGNSGTSGVLKSRGSVGLRDAQDPDARADEHEREQRADAGHVADDVDRARRPAKAPTNRKKIGSTCKACRTSGGSWRRPSGTGRRWAHREEHPRLPEQHHQDDRREAGRSRRSRTWPASRSHRMPVDRVDDRRIVAASGSLARRDAGQDCANRM